MRRGSVFLLGSGTMLLGILVGATLDSWRLEDAAQAHVLTPEESERLYLELGSGQGPLFDGGRLMAKVARLTSPSVVHIQSERDSLGKGRIEETGSGVLMTSPKLAGHFVVTNRHVIAEAELRDISIHLYDGRVLNPERVWADRATDIAVLQVNADGLYAARWGDSDSLEIGHIVLAMGSPFGLSQSLTFGIVSAKGRRSLKLDADSAVLNQDFLQTDAAINPGNSGGPLIDLHGRVVGINTAIASNSGGNEGIGFSIPSNLARRVVDQLLEHGTVQRAYLGVKLDPDFDAATARRFRLDRRRGARVLEVYPNTPASSANLQFNDVILSFNGIDVQDENHLINLVSLTPVGRRVRVVVWRDSQRMTLEVLLADRSELEQRSEVPRMQPGVGVQVESMGLTLEKIDQGIARQIGFDARAQGLLVLNVNSAGPLAQEIELYDLIEEVARTPVSTIDDLHRIVGGVPTDEPIVLKVRRREGGDTQSRVVIWRR